MSGYAEFLYSGYFVSLRFARSFIGELAFDRDFKIAFGGAFGKNGHSDFAANLHAKFEVDFFDFNAGQVLERTNDVPGVDANGSMDIFGIGFDFQPLPAQRDHSFRGLRCE